MKTTRYDIYIKDNYNKDGTFNVVIRDNELLARWLVDGGGDGDYTKSYYDIDDHSLALLKAKYKDNATYYWC